MKKTQTQQDMSTTIGRKQLKTAITNQKEILREKCFSRIKNKRKHILEQLRNVQNQCALSEEERDQLDREFLEQQLKDILDECQNECEDELNTIDYYELLAEMQMEIDEYYKQEETDVLEERDQYSDELDEYEENLRFEQLMLNSDLPPPDFEETDDNCLVICPVCKRNELLHTPHSLFCQCGLRIVTEVSGYYSLIFN